MRRLWTIERLPKKVGRLLRESKATVSVAESCTGGWVSQLLTSEAGASDFFVGGMVPYWEAMKTSWLGISSDKISHYGVVSKEIAVALATAIRSHGNSQWGLSTTGYAGPTGGTPRDPIGTVYFGVVGPRGQEIGERAFFKGSRERIRRLAAFHALDFLGRQLLKRGTNL